MIYRKLPMWKNDPIKIGTFINLSKIMIVIEFSNSVVFVSRKSFSFPKRIPANISVLLILRFYLWWNIYECRKRTVINYFF